MYIFTYTSSIHFSQCGKTFTFFTLRVLCLQVCLFASRLDLIFTCSNQVLYLVHFHQHELN